MAHWDTIIRFAAEDGTIYFAPMPLETIPKEGAKVEAFSSIQAIETERSGGMTTIKSVRARRNAKRHHAELMMCTVSASGACTSRQQPYYLHRLELQESCRGSKGSPTTLVSLPSKSILI
jgi:hypothetical protein